MDVVCQPIDDNLNKKNVKSWRWTLRGGQIILNLLGLIASGIVIGDLKSETPWQVWVWYFIMLVQLILSISGAVLYGLAKLCDSEETWKITAAAYNIIQSHIILFAYLLGTQNYMFLFRVPGLKKSPKDYAAVIGAVICQADSIYHFIYAFMAGPRPIRSVRVNAENVGPSKSKGEMGGSEDPSVSSFGEMASLTETVDTVASVASTNTTIPTDTTNDV